MRTNRAFAGTLVSTVLFGLLAISVQPASAHARSDDPLHVTVTKPDGTVHSFRALLPEEIVARGLNKNVPHAELRVVAPQFIDSRDAKVVPPVRNPKGTSSITILSCWGHTTDQGWAGGGGLWSRTEVTWCSDGTWINYTVANCFGIDGGYPTYEFISCQINQVYGAGWSGWDVKTIANLCDAWIPLWGSCAHNRTFWERWAYGAQGQIYFLENHDG
ncbi:hypothetical protein Rhe02_19080 [Rhizocola hellebori]|uniref:Secreted protein n=1 Tax=Rhizocola hellebori TaxID=1392758 RepID=A0A8J3Q512_9ACTN|nr:hypothetical protein [Rhizocola hellebori]GIH03841.1 hypothetical protein Rhe02_19080 [Rhizocola hellebori]